MCLTEITILDGIGYYWYCSVYIYTFTQSNQKMLTEVLIFTFHL